MRWLLVAHTCSLQGTLMNIQRVPSPNGVTCLQFSIHLLLLMKECPMFHGQASRQMETLVAKRSNEEAPPMICSPLPGIVYCKCTGSWLPYLDPMGQNRQTRAQIKANQSGEEVEGERRKKQPSARWIDPSCRDNGAPRRTRERPSWRMSTWTLGAKNNLKTH